MRRNRKRNGERGQAMVEFALSVPVFFAVVYGICDFGRALFTYDLVTSAARIGSRYAIVHGSACTLSSCPATSATIQTYVRSQVNGINTSQLTVTAAWSKGTGCTDTAFKGPQCIVNVTVSYPFQFVLALQESLTMTSSSQMVISQ